MVDVVRADSQPLRSDIEQEALHSLLVPTEPRQRTPVVAARFRAYAQRMLVCSSPELVRWQPDLSSSCQASPQWTRLVCAGVELCNTMEWSDWSDVDLVQLIVCEECGYAGCENGGYARVSRLGGHVLLTPPLVDPADAWAVTQYRPSHAIREHGAVAIATAHWEEWRHHFRNLPAPDALAASRRSDLK